MKFILGFLILFGNLFSELIIKTEENEFTFNKGTLFSVNSDTTKIAYESFNGKFINNSININSIEYMIIYKNKNSSNSVSKKILPIGMIITSIVAFNEDSWLFEPKDIFQIGGTITLALMILGSIIENTSNSDTLIEIKNQDCGNETSCTEWILLNKK